MSYSLELSKVWVLTLLVTASGWLPAAEGGGPQALLQRFNDYPHAMLIANSSEKVVGHELGLGALQKVLGDWKFKRSVRLDGELLRYSWQIIDGFSSIEVLAELEQAVGAMPDAQSLFSCEGRACGHGAQWANRVFNQRVLYGRSDMQRYRVYSLMSADISYRLVMYASARTTDRQYLHVELLQINEVTTEF